MKAVGDRLRRPIVIWRLACPQQLPALLLPEPAASGLPAARRAEGAEHYSALLLAQGRGNMEQMLAAAAAGAAAAPPSPASTPALETDREEDASVGPQCKKARRRPATRRPAASRPTAADQAASWGFDFRSSRSRSSWTATLLTRS